MEPLVTISGTSGIINNSLHIQTECKSADSVEMDNEVQAMRKGKRVQDESPFVQSNLVHGSKMTNNLHMHIPPALPPISQLDLSILESLPSDILKEIDDAYNGLLANKNHGAIQGFTDADVLLKNRAGFDKSASSSNAFVGHVHLDDQFLMETKQENTVAISYGTKATIHANQGHQEKETESLENGAQVCKESFITNTLTSGDIKFSDMVETISPHDLMPMSVSQIDKAVLEELPTQLRKDLLDALPAHSGQKRLQEPPGLDTCNGMDILSSERHSVVEPCSDLKCSSKEAISEEFCELWKGSPPKWVRLFHESSGPGSKYLRFISSQYQCKAADDSFVAFLLSLVTYLSDPALDDSEDFCKVVSYVSEVVKQFVQTLVSANLEEIWTILRLVKRTSTRVRFWGEVHNILLPSVQDYVSECYGGKLSIR